MIGNNNIIEANLINMSQEAALVDHKKTLTNESLSEEVFLMRRACECMDVLI